MTIMWEQRWHPLREEWVIVAAHRQDRPWIGQMLAAARAPLPAYDPECYLCPGNVRVGGHVNPRYDQTHVFDNDLPCVGEHAPADLPAAPGIYQNRPAQGIARVICFDPRHDLTLAEMSVERIVQVIRVWQEQYLELGSRPEVRHMLAFENKGEAVGVSNPHPHGQIYATNFVFKTIEIEAQACRRHRHETGRVLFADIIESETRDGRRILADSASALAFVPYFARYAYEVFVAPKQTHASVANLSPDEVDDLARVLKTVLVKFDNLWRITFPYVMALHQAPTDGANYSGFHFHIELHPPLRKPGVLKYLAGPEIGGGSFLSDTSPEEKVQELRKQSEIHYKQQEMKPQMNTDTHK